MRLLIVEDEEKTSSYIRRAFLELSYSIDVADNGNDGLYLALENDYDAIILDVMLPGMDGYSLLECLRAEKQTPVLMLSARSTVDERVRGLRSGADDYLLKPFSLIELVARIQALHRRMPKDNNDQTHICIDDLQLDLISRKVSRGGVRIDLTAKEFSLLSLLARHQGKILSKMMIADEVWDMNFDSDANVVEVAIKRLRNKIDTPYSVKLLYTVRGMGYVLEPRTIQVNAI